MAIRLLRSPREAVAAERATLGDEATDDSAPCATVVTRRADPLCGGKLQADLAACRPGGQASSVSFHVADTFDVVEKDATTMELMAPHHAAEHKTFPPKVQTYLASVHRGAE